MPGVEIQDIATISGIDVRKMSIDSWNQVIVLPDYSVTLVLLSL